jgi:hypothetical protein
MSKRFIVDFRIASEERNTYFSDDWQWPVEQSTYDDVLREFIEYAYRLPGDLSHNQPLKLAYELVEVDLLKELVSIVAVWIDVAVSKQKQLDLVFHPQQTLYEMFSTDRFESYSTVQEIYKARYGTLRSKVGRRLRRFGRWSGVNRISNPNLSISPNKLTSQITPESTTDFRIDPDDLSRARSNQSTAVPGIDELVDEILSHLDHSLKKIDAPFTTNGRSFLGELIANHLRNGSADQNVKLPVSNLGHSTHLYTGTGGIYRSRLASHLITREGGAVTRATHGGDTVLFEDPVWVNTELLFATNYVSYGAQAADVIRRLATEHPRAQSLQSVPTIYGAGSDYHSDLVPNTPSANSIEKDGSVAVIAASFTGERRVVPHVKVHDVVYLEWHSRLLDSIRELGYKAISKRHPKGIGSDLNLFTPNSDTELTQVGMASLANVEGFVLDIAGSAFMEAMCSLKPVVLIDIPTRRITSEGRSKILESAQIVKAEFAPSNRIQIEVEQLKEALAQPVDLEARHRFLSDYLLRPSAI